MTTLPTLPSFTAALSVSARGLLAAARAAADEAGVELWVVGGALRDCAAGRPPGDLDLAVASDDPATAERIARLVVDRCGGGEVTHEPRFGTASATVEAARLEIATLRTEHYARPGALPEVRLGASIEGDLLRRDFTVNALALAVAGPRRGELLDPLGGLDDLAARRLRALHERSFVDDATRLWRGARYAAALDLRPERATAQWIAEGHRWLAQIAGARLWSEFARTSAQRRVARSIGLLDAWGVLRGTHPGWSVPGSARNALRHRPGPHPPELLIAVLLAALPARDAITERLTAPRAAQDAVDDAARLLDAAEASPEALERLERTGGPARLAAAWIEPERQQPLQRALRRWERTRAPLDARALERLGVHPGPEMGAWLRRLRRQRYLGTLSSAAAARTLVRAALARERGDAGGGAR